VTFVVTVLMRWCRVFPPQKVWGSHRTVKICMGAEGKERGLYY